MTKFFRFLSQAALRQITDKAREFGAGPLFNQILPLLMSPTLEDQVIPSLDAHIKMINDSCLIIHRGFHGCSIVKVYSLLLARGYSVEFTQYPWS